MNQIEISRRNMLVGTGALLAGGSLTKAAGALSGEPIPQTQGVRIGVITDVHQDIMHDGEQRLTQFVKAMRDVDPDMIVQLGDFCVPHERNDKFLSIFHAFARPHHHVIGNHETDGGYTREQVVEYFGMPSRYYSFDHEHLHFVVLDGNDRGGSSGGYPRFIAPDQVNWLRDDLASTRLPTIVMVHQPLDSSDGVDNRADIRAVLEQANQSPDQAHVIAVLAGHSHIDLGRSINGILYLTINSASYQWVGSKHKHMSYPPEVHAQAPSLDRTCPYRDPLWAVLTIDLEHQVISVEGRSSSWVGPSPDEIGADWEHDYWGWNPRYAQPRISSWRIPFATSGDIA